MQKPSMLGRPEKNEAGAYYFTYIDRISGTDVVGTIENQLDASVAFFSEISEAKSLYQYAPDKWSIRQVLSHVTDTERAFAFRTL